MGVTRAERLGVAWPALAVTAVSAASMALEIVAGRALAPYVGMSLYTWTVIIAVVLAGLSLGHWIGGRIADATRHPARAVAVALSGAAVTTLLCLAALRLAAPLAAEAGPVPHVTALAMAAFFLPSALAGVVSPLLTVIALAAAPEGRQGRVLGLMYALGAVGAILGTLAAGLLMISWLGTAGSVALIGLVYAALSLRFWRARGAAVAGAVTAAVAAAAGSFPGALGLTTACLRESPHFCIRVDDLAGVGRPARVMALDHLAHGVNDRDDPRLLLSPYVQGVDELVARRFGGPALSAFFVGGGAYTLPRAWQARYPAGEFLVAEIDPAVTEIAEARMWFEPGPHMEIRHGDARRVLAGLAEDRRFDVIFGDAFHDISIPQHLVTDEFHALVARRLKPGGVYVLNVVDALREPRFMLSLARTLELRFESVELWMDRASIQPAEARATWIVLASDRPTGADRIAAKTGFARDWVRVPLDAMVRAVGPEALVRLTDDYAPVARLLAPVLLDASLAEGGR